MHNLSKITPDLLPLDDPLHNYLTSSNFSSNTIWKITFSPCSQYLAIPKQDIYGQDCVVVIHCPNWQANKKTDELYVHEEFPCLSPVWSLAFGQCTENNIYTKSRLNISVNHRFDFTKNLFLAAGLANGDINIWNIDTKELTLVLTDHQLTVCGLSITPYTMQLASCSHDTTIKLWDLLDDGNMYKTIADWTHVIDTVKWSPDESLLCAVGPYELVILYDTSNWKELFRLEKHLHNVVDCAFSSDSALLATASFDTCVLLWSTVTGELIKEFFHSASPLSKIYAGGDNGAFVRSIVFSKYNHYLVTTCDDNTIRWFSVGSVNHTKSILERKQNNPLCITITSDGKTIATGTRKGEVHIRSSILINKPISLKSLCRIQINHYAGMKRKDFRKNLTIPQHLINYLLYKCIKIK